MPSHGRIPRPKHLFPDLAAAYFAFRRWGLRVERFFHEEAGWYPVWTIGAVSGTMGLMLAVLLFVFHDPAPVVGTMTPVAATIPPEPAPVSPLIPLASEPLPVIEEVLPSPRLSQGKPRLQLMMNRLTMSSAWNEKDHATLARSAAPQRDAPLLEYRDLWRQTFQRPAVPQGFEPYFLSTHAFPVSPVIVLASNQFDSLRPVSSSRISGLQIDKVMTATASLGSPYSYSIFVRNVSGDVIPSVEVRERMTALHRVSKVEPDAHVEADELVWHLNQIPAGDVRELKITLLPDELTEIIAQTSLTAISRVGAAVHVVPGTMQPAPLPEPVMEPEPVLPSFIPVIPEPVPLPVEEPITPELAPAVPEEPEVTGAPALRLEVSQVGVLKRGDTLSLVFEVSNVGTATAENVVINVQLSPEFQHRYGKSVEHRIVRLDPGATHKALLKAVAREVGAGQLSTELTMKGARQEQADVTVPVQPIEDNQVQPAGGEQMTLEEPQAQTCFSSIEEVPSDAVQPPLLAQRR